MISPAPLLTTRRHELPELVRRALDRKAVQIEHVGIDLSRAQILVAQEFLDRADVHAVGQQVCGERVAEGVAAGVLLDLQLADRGVDGLLQKRWIEMMAPPGTAPRVDRGPGGRIHVLLAPPAIRLRATVEVERQSCRVVRTWDT